MTGLGSKAVCKTYARADGLTLRWTFTHESDTHALDRVYSVIDGRSPLLLVRVVREPLANVEAFFRYQSAGPKGAPKGSEPSRVPEWERFAPENLKLYTHFHQYWARQCAQRCCLRTTYERVKEVPVKLLAGLFASWLPAGVAIPDVAIDAAVTKFSPKHSGEQSPVNASEAAESTGTGPPLPYPKEWQWRLDFSGGRSFAGVRPELVSEARTAARLGETGES
jgi:hypothetical protein